MDSPATPPKPAVCLLSGGLDSATALAVARREGYRCYALSFDYGQRHRVELEAAARVASSLGAAEHRVVLDRSARVRRIGADGRYRGAEDGRGRRAFRSPTFPRAIRFSSRSRWLGPKCSRAPTSSSASTRSTTPAIPDCRPEFIEAFETYGQPGDQGRRGRPHAR